MHTFDNGRGSGDASEGEVLQQSRCVELSRASRQITDDLRVGREGATAVLHSIVQRSLAESIPCQDQGLSVCVMERQAEGAV